VFFEKKQVEYIYVSNSLYLIIKEVDCYLLEYEMRNLTLKLSYYTSGEKNKVVEVKTITNKVNQTINFII
jgi:hypothetical protein